MPVKARMDMPPKKRSTKKTTHEESLNRLARIEGQIRGIQRMVKDQAYCVDIITQIQAATSALRAVGRKVLQKHIEHCVADTLKGKRPSDINQKIDEIMNILRREP